MPVLYKELQLEHPYRYIKKIFIEPDVQLIAILKLNMMFKISHFENHYQLSFQSDEKWDTEDEIVEFTPENISDQLFNPQIDFPNALCNSQVDKYDSRISKKGCCISVHVKLLPLQECYEYSASALSKSERRMYDKICARQSNNTLRNGFEGKEYFGGRLFCKTRITTLTPKDKATAEGGKPIGEKFFMVGISYDTENNEEADEKTKFINILFHSQWIKRITNNHRATNYASLFWERRTDRENSRISISENDGSNANEVQIYDGSSLALLMSMYCSINFVLFIIK